MKSLLSSRPTLWFLFLFNLAIAAVAPFLVDGAQGLMTSVGMGVVSIGAGAALFRNDAPNDEEGVWVTIVPGTTLEPRRMSSSSY